MFFYIEFLLFFIINDSLKKTKLIVYNISQKKEKIKSQVCFSLAIPNLHQ